MSKIAVVDLLFNWPPDGGARTDIKEISSRLARTHELRMFVPDLLFHFPRGRVLGELGFPVVKIPFTPLSFNFIQAAHRFRLAVDEFCPDHLFIADGWFLKPYIVNALRKYHPVVRLYAHESLCFNFHGTFMRKGRQCAIRWLRSGIATQLLCVECGLTAMRGKCNAHFIQEFFASLAFSPTYKMVMRSSLRNARAVIVYNSFIRDMIDDCARDVRIIPSGVDHVRFFYQQFPRGDIKKILMVGRVSDWTKGFPLLQQVCRELWRKRKDFRLIVTVDGEQRYGEPFIETRAWMPQEKLPSLYAEADLCVFPSLWQEPQGIAPLEAMSCGRPVVVTRVGGLQCLVEDGVQGFVVPPGDANALKQAVSRLLDDQALRERMGRAARERVEERYTWDIIYDRYYAHLFE